MENTHQSMDIFHTFMDYIHYFLKVNNMNPPLVETLEDRLRKLIDAEAPGTRKWKDMETATGVSSSSWQDFHRGKKRATAEMIEALAKKWPEYAFWLATGISDPDFGHGAPANYGFPRMKTPRENSIALFKRRMEFKSAAREITAEYMRIEDLAEFTLDDRFIDMAVSIVRYTHGRSGNEEIDGIDATRFFAAMQAHEQAERLRRAEILLQNEMEDSSYELMGSLLEKIDKLMKSASPEQRQKLEALIVKEKAAVDRNRDFSKKYPDIAKAADKMMMKYNK